MDHSRSCSESPGGRGKRKKRGKEKRQLLTSRSDLLMAITNRLSIFRINNCSSSFSRISKALPVSGRGKREKKKKGGKEGPSAAPQ